MYQLIDPADIVAELRLIRQLLERQRPGAAADRPADAPLSMAQAAKLFGVCERHVARLCDTGEIPSFRIGRRRFISAATAKAVAAAGLSSGKAANKGK